MSHFSKEVPGEYEISEQGNVTTEPYDVGRIWVKGGPDGDLHFVWNDDRCLPHLDHHDESLFYRKKSNGSWVEGDRICDTTWTDAPTVVNIDCDCCKPGTTCCEHYPPCAAPCPLFNATGKPYVDSQSRVHFVWRDTDSCWAAFNGSQPDSVETDVTDVIFRRMLDSDGTTWCDTIRVSQWTSNNRGADLTPGDSLALVWEDKIGDRTAIWYALESPEAACNTSADPRWLYVISDDPDYADVGTNSTAKIHVDVDDSSRLHVVWLDNDPGAITNVFHQLVRPYLENEGDQRGTACKITNYAGITPDVKNLTTEMDACGNVHVFYRRDIGVATTPTYYRKVVGDSTARCTVLSPEGGDVWYTDSSPVIEWLLCPGIAHTVDSLKIFLSKDAGTTWTCLGRRAVLSRSYRWDIGGGGSEEACLIRLSAYWHMGDSTGVCSDTSEIFSLKCRPGATPAGIDSTKCTVVASPGSLFVCPCGEYPGNGRAIDILQVSVTLRDESDDPVDSTCVRLGVVLTPVDMESLLCVCGDPDTIVVTDITDNLGVITLTVAELGGCGYIDITATVDGIEIPDTARVRIHSPDIDGDCDVDLVDSGLFTGWYNGTNWCGDYDISGTVLLPDFGTFAAHYNHDCETGDFRSDGGVKAIAIKDIVLSTPASRVMLGRKGEGLVDLVLESESFERTRYNAIEVLVSYDASAGRPVQWDGCGEMYFMRVEQVPAGGDMLHLVRVISALSKSGRDEESNVLGVLRFSLIGETNDVGAEAVSVKALSSQLKIVDVTSSFRQVTPGLDISERKYAIRPVLEVAPNPSTGLTQLIFGVPEWMGRRVEVSVYDVRGRMVARVHDGANDGLIQAEELGVTRGQLPFASPGVYFVRMTVDGRALKSRKMVLLH